MNKLFTSEAVSAGHPDKMCDQISDAILDYCMAYDNQSKVAIECLVTERTLIIAGEVRTDAILTNEMIVEISKRKIKEIGYDKPELGFSYNDLEIGVFVHAQSEDIALGVDKGGAGDQGMVIGGAIYESPNYLPYSLELSTAIMEKYNEYIKSKTSQILFPDAKCQVTIEKYNEDSYGIDSVVISAHHAETATKEQVDREIIVKVLQPALDEYMEKYDLLDEELKTNEFKLFINPTGKFSKGGPAADTGVTGRKIICDTYGGYFGHGGGAFSGKDPSKIDRSAAYMARHIAKTIVGTRLANYCVVKLAYIIGKSEPCSISIETDNNEIDTDTMILAVKKVFDLTPNGITKQLRLRNSNLKYSDIAKGCHFRNEKYPWESFEKIDLLESAYQHYLIQR